ncbi:MAG TPA: hypothetical protein VMH80_09880 [Bryobacteraceae bacterium]|nr:hypothetical protein [Bryobacteraceae bacterium]
MSAAPPFVTRPGYNSFQYSIGLNRPRLDVHVQKNAAAGGLDCFNICGYDPKPEV